MAVQKNTYTLEDYYAFIALPENTDRIFEFIDGEFVEKMPSFTPSRLAGLIITFLNLYLFKNPIGHITAPDGGYRMPNGDVLIPDVAFISNERLPEEPNREAPVPPDLAVEVKWPTDSKRKMRRNAEKYLDFGTRIVWLVFPEDQMIEVYIPDNDDVINVGMDGTLNGGDVLPDFTLAVKDIFR